MGSIDWKWFLVGLFFGWLALPMLQGFFLKRRAAAA